MLISIALWFVYLMLIIPILLMGNLIFKMFLVMYLNYSTRMVDHCFFLVDHCFFLVSISFISPLFVIPVFFCLDVTLVCIYFFLSRLFSLACSKCNLPTFSYHPLLFSAFPQIYIFKKNCLHIALLSYSDIVSLSPTPSLFCISHL